jgi:hypothetical protein
MSTNQTYITLSGPHGAVGFAKNATDDQWNTCTDNVQTLNLHEVFKGRVVNAIVACYTAGSGMMRVRNTQTNKIKMFEPLTILKGLRFTPLERPFVVEVDDILEVYTTAAGT